MTTARKSLISLQDTPYYHCVSHCVRSTYLCGKDKLTGRSYEHRRGWIEQRLTFLGEIFAIDICAYAVMTNHTHVVLHVDKAKALRWSKTEVIQRYHRLHKGALITHDFKEGKSLSRQEFATLEQTVAVYRQRLCDISWFMRSLNEYIARQANKEDKCKGRFWEGRFKSQALLDDAALLACMAYVDLNPNRQKLARTLETSRHTSIRARVLANMSGDGSCKGLMPFNGQVHNPRVVSLPFTFHDYTSLIENTAPSVYSARYKAPSFSSALLSELGISVQRWLSLCSSIESRFGPAIGTSSDMNRFKSKVGLKRIRGKGAAILLYDKPSSNVA